MNIDNLNMDKSYQCKFVQNNQGQGPIYLKLLALISSQPVPLFWELHLNAGAQVEPQLHCQLRVVERGTSVLRTRSIRHHLPWCPRRPRAHHQLWAGHGGNNLALVFSSTKNHFCSEPRSGIWTVGMFTVELSIDLVINLVFGLCMWLIVILKQFVQT